MPWPEAARRIMPKPTVPSHAPRPAGMIAAGRRHPRVPASPMASPARNGHAVLASPVTLAASA